MLRGREPEIRRITALIDAVGRGEGEVLGLHGPPGIGKTTLLDHAERVADGMTVLRVSGYEAEATLPFATLRRLLTPIEHLRGQLPAVQAQALAGALGWGAPTPPAGVAVPMAILTMLEVASAERPVLLLVDDLQWLDPASREALLFVARRLGPGPVGLLLAGRDPLDRSGIPQHDVPPLDDAEAHFLLERLGHAPAPPVRSVIVEAAGGNPLALLELAASLRPEQRTGDAPLDAPLRPGPLLRAAFGQRVARLTGDERRSFEVAAAMEHGSVAWLLAALDVLGIDREAISAAERDGLLVVRDGRAGLFHSVLRAVAYHETDPDDRRAAHRALAETADDPPRRAWHLAAAATDTDDGVAAELDGAAELSRAVGGHAEAAAAYVRAAELSASPTERARRQLAAAQDLAVVGDRAQALRLLDTADESISATDRPAVERLRGSLAMRGGDLDTALRTLIAAGERCLADGRHAVAAELFLEAAVVPMMTGDLTVESAVVERAQLAAGPDGTLRTLADLVAAELLVVRGEDVAGDAALAAACARIDDLDPVEHGDIVGMAAQTSLWLGAFDRAAPIIARVVDAARESGALGRLTYPLGVRATLAHRQGRWADAERDAAEAVQLGRDSGQEPMLAFALSVRGRLHATRGDGESARADLDEAAEIVARHQADGIAIHVHATRVLTELLDGAFDAALDAADTTRAFEVRLGHRQPGATIWVGDEIEALVAAGRTEAAVEAVERMAAHAQARGSRWAAMVAARGAVLLAADDGIDAAADAARGCDALADLPLERARTELVIGERLRRANRRADAREPLALAAAEFERLGATAFAARAGVGQDTPTDAPADGPTLTAVERRIVRLVAEGRTNRELAADLHLGQKTLERRLSALYRKLGVSSRTALARLDRR